MKNHTNAENQPDNFSATTEIFCPVHLTVGVFAGKWKLPILWHLRTGIKRFGELSRAIPAITQSMLSIQLKELEEDGIISRTLFPEVPPRVEYSLSAIGKSLIPLIVSIEKWGIEYGKKNKGSKPGECRWSDEL